MLRVTMKLINSDNIELNNARKIRIECGRFTIVHIDHRRDGKERTSHFRTGTEGENFVSMEITEET